MKLAFAYRVINGVFYFVLKKVLNYIFNFLHFKVLWRLKIPSSLSTLKKKNKRIIFLLLFSKLHKKTKILQKTRVELNLKIKIRV